jgi:hypothetical protein
LNQVWGDNRQRRQELEGNQSGKIARTDSMLGLFILHAVQHGNYIRKRTFFRSTEVNFQDLGNIDFKHQCEMAVQ